MCNSLRAVAQAHAPAVAVHALPQVDQQPVSLSTGTPLYASPEQLTGYNADQAWGRPKLRPSADIWSLGVTLCAQKPCAFFTPVHEFTPVHILLAQVRDDCWPSPF